MTIGEARAMISRAGRWDGTGEQWADLGCGRGTFTLALAGLLGVGSTIVAVDEDREALSALPDEYEGVHIRRRQATMRTVEFDAPLHGILMANSLHYDAEPAILLDRLSQMLRPGGRVLLVEYDTDIPLPPWVPYPVSSARARSLLEDAGFTRIRRLASRPSVYGRSPLYSLMASVPIG